MYNTLRYTMMYGVSVFWFEAENQSVGVFYTCTPSVFIEVYFELKIRVFSQKCRFLARKNDPSSYFIANFSCHTLFLGLFLSRHSKWTEIKLKFYLILFGNSNFAAKLNKKCIYKVYFVSKILLWGVGVLYTSIHHDV